MTRSRFLTSSLAAVAIASAITFTAAPANAADAQPGTQTCGQPAVTLPHEAITHQEWLWQYDEVSAEAYTRYQFERTLQEYGYTTYDWTRHVVTQEYVPGVPAVPAVYEILHEWQLALPDSTETTDWVRTAPANEEGYGDWTQIDEKTVEDAPAQTEERIDPNEPEPYAFVQDNTGKVEYRDSASFNGGDDPEHDKGWNRDSALDKTITVIIKPAETHEEYRFQRVVPGGFETQWAADSPGSGWVDTGQTTTGDLITPAQDAVPAIEEESHDESSVTTAPTPPAGDDWQLVDSTLHTMSSYTAPDTSTEPWQPVGTGTQELGWSLDPNTAPEGDGWSATGVTENVAAQTQPVLSQSTSAFAPDQLHEWTKVADSVTTVTDKEAWTETITEATAPCPDPVVDPVVDPVDDPVDDGGVSSPSAPVVKPKPIHFEQVLGGDRPAVAAPQPQAALAPQGGVLPNTGNGASLGLTLAGLGSLAGGAVLMMASRRRRFAER